MSIPDEVKLPNLDQIYRRQRLASLARCGDALPTPLVMIAERVEVKVEVSGSTFRTTDLAHGHVSYPDVTVITYGTRSPYLIQSEPRRAIEYYEQALSTQREIGDRRGEGNQLGNLGLAYANLGEPRRAIENYEQALTIAREIGDRRNEAIHSWNLGLLYEETDPARAVELMSVLVAYEREIGHPDAEIHAKRVARIQARLEGEG